MKKYVMLLGIGFMLFSMSSCLVAKKKYDEEVARANKLLAEKENCEENLAKANATIEDLNNQIKGLKKEIQDLKDSNADLTAKLEESERLRKEVDIICERVKKQLDDIVASSSSEKDKMQKELAQKQADLLKKEQELAELRSTLNKLQADLNDREAKVRDLESLIARKDSAVQALRKKLTDALLGFKDSELTVSVRDGKVYVSMSDKLLFNTGSFVVEAKGKDALKKIAEVLNKQSDLKIVVEGHTDNQRYSSNTSGPINSNWDLSVMRASSVTKILVDENKVDNKRITPAGRGEFYPIESNDTPEGRSKNRRIEIVIEPDMKGIFDIINGGN